MSRVTLSKIINRLSFSKKFALIGMVLLLPLGYTTKAYVGLQSSQSGFAAKERQGTQYVKPVNDLLAALVGQRSQTVLALSSGSSAPPAKLDDQIAAVDKVDAKYGASFKTTSMWQQLKSQIASTTTATYATAKDSFDAYNKVTASTVALVTQAGNESNLILDPDLDSFYLMDTIVVQTPDLADATGQLRDLSVMASAPNKTAVGDLGHIDITMALVEGDIQTRNNTIQGDFTTVFAKTADKNLKSALNEPFGAEQDAVNQVLDLASQNKPLVEQGTAAVKTVSGLAERHASPGSPLGPPNCKVPSRGANG